MDKLELFTDELVTVINAKMKSVDSAFHFSDTIIEVYTENGDTYLIKIEKK